MSSSSDPRYELLREIGRGGGGVVWLGRDRVSGHEVAIKTAAPGAEPAVAERIGREHALLDRVRHPHLVRALARVDASQLDASQLDASQLDASQLDASRLPLPSASLTGPAAVLELLAGPSLAEAGLEIEAGLKAWAQVAHALEALHSHGYVHRDLRPENVILRTEARGPESIEAVLTDLGAAALEGLEVEAVGTPDYLAPETLLDAAPRPSADVHGLGGLLFFLLTGKAPWAELDLEASLAARSKGPPPLPEGAVVPPPLRRVLHRLLAPSPWSRPRSALDAVRLLNAETGRALPEERGRLSARPGLAGFVGRAAELASLEELLASQEPRRVLLRGLPGSGRSRLLDELELRARLAGRRVHRSVPAEPETRDVMLVDDEWSLVEVHPSAGLLVETAPPQGGSVRVDAEILLGPLSEEECLELAGALLGLGPLEGGDGAVLLAASGGLPGPLEQVLASLAESGGLKVEGARLHVDAEAAGERQGVAALLEQRTSRLSAEAAVLVDLASLFREPVEGSLLAALAHSEPDAQGFQAALAELRHGGLIRAVSDDRRGPRYEVPSPARAAIHDRLPAARRRLLHLGAATLLARLSAGSEAEQAWHLEEAGAGERAAPLHRKAGAARLQEGRPREAAVHLRRALEATERGSAEWGSLSMDLARAEALLGDAASAVRRVEDALDSFTDDEQRAHALAFAAETASHAGDPKAAEAACRRARRLFRRVGSRRGRAECTSRLAQLALGRGELRRANGGFRAALEVARQEGDTALEARALNNLGTIARRRGELDEAARHHDEAHRLRRRTGDLQGAAKALNNLGIVKGMAGRLDEAAETFGRAIATFREVGDRREEARALNNRGMVLWLDSRLDEAAETFSEAAGIFESLGDEGLRAEALRNEALVALDRGEPAIALALLETGLENMSSRPVAERVPLLLDLGDSLRALGRFERARSAHEEAASAEDGIDAALGRLACALDEALAGRVPADLPEPPEGLEEAGAEEALRWHLEAGRLAEAKGDLEVASGHGRAAARLAAREGGEHDKLWAAILLAGPEPTGSALNALQDAVGEVPAGHVPDVAWRARLRLARGHSAAGRRLMAGAQAEAASELLDSMARRLDDEARQSFEASPERASARPELERLAQVPGASATTDAAVAPVLLEFVRVLNAQLEVEALLPRVVDFAIELTGAERGCLILFDSEPEGVRVARGRGGEDLPRERFQHSHTIVQEVRRSGKPVVVESFAGDEQVLRSQSVHELRLGSATCVPLPEPAGVGGGSLGAIYVDSPTRRSGFSEREVDTLTAIAAHAATAIVNAQLLQRARAEKDSLADEVERLRAGTEGFGEVLGRSPAMQEVFSLLERVAVSEANVLLEGESGTGKELAARSIHARSRRAKGPFVAVDLGTLPESLVESELFGHRKGAFTGADRDRPGLFEEAGGGTIFLDEVGNTSAPLQARLLRVLQEREARRVGDDRSRPLDVRVVAASNRLLANEVAAGRFREDLFYRLNVVSIRLPPLRERPEDVPLLARHFLECAAAREGKRLEGFQPAALSLLARFDWPGNVRQLQNVVERAVVMSAGTEIGVDDLPPAIVGRGPSVPPASSQGEDGPAAPAPRFDLWTAVVERGADFWESVRDPFAGHDLTRDDVIALVSRALMRTGGKYKGVARLLGIAPDDYKRFMDFLRQNRCRVDFRPFREAAKRARAGESDRPGPD